MFAYDGFRSLVGRFSIYLLAFTCTKREYCLCIQILNPKLCQMSPPYLPICGISTSFYINLQVPTLMFKINFGFVCPYRSWSGMGWLVSSMLNRLLSRWVFIHLSLHESMAVIGMPSPKNKKYILRCQIINSLEIVGMDGTHGCG